MSRLIAGLAALALCGAALAQVPQQSLQYLPMLQKEAVRLQSPVDVSIVAGQIDHETACPVIKKCWNPATEFRTSRELGAGWGQFTVIAGRFDALAETRAAHMAELAGWSWKNPGDPVFQTRAIFLKTKDNYMAMERLFDDPLLPTITAWNRGAAGIRADRRKCQITAGCDPKKWTGHVKNTCAGNSTVIPGTKRTACQISRAYADDVMARSKKYRKHFEDAAIKSPLDHPHAKYLFRFRASPFFSGIGG